MIRALPTRRAGRTWLELTERAAPVKMRPRAADAACQELKITTKLSCPHDVVERQTEPAKPVGKLGIYRANFVVDGSFAIALPRQRNELLP